MSANDRPEARAFRELEMLVHNLGEELATFRRRALSAESQLRGDAAPPAAGRPRPASPERIAELEAENESLRMRLSRSEERLRQMLDRVRFLRQQLQTQPAVGAARS
jgi:hypothetical protein